MLRALNNGSSAITICALRCNHKLLPATFARYASKYTKPETDSEFYGQQLGGYEHVEEIEPFKSRWRKPFTERSYWKTKFALFGSRKFPADKTRYNPVNFKFFNFNHWMNTKKKDKLRENQQFIEERLQILGCDLAAAHFVVYREGAVKFQNHSDWIRDDEKNQDYDDKLPNTYTPGFVVEGIDLSGTSIVYDGLKNIYNLEKLKWLSFRQCKYFDNWCLDRLSGEYGDNVEYLDISFTKVNYHGLNAIYRFRKLKTLVLDDMSDEPEFYQTCIVIKRFMPDLTITGIAPELMPFLGNKAESINWNDQSWTSEQVHKKTKANVN